METEGSISNKPTTTTTTPKPPPRKLDLSNLRALKLLGKGAMGTVFLAYDRHSDPMATAPFALKVADKSLFPFKSDADRRARWEISVLSAFPGAHPFLPTLLGYFETPELLGWALPFCPGGDLNALRFHQPDRVFSPAAIKFYLAEIICALEHLHAAGIAYRDLKPENVLVQGSGHVTLTDFDLTQKLTHNNRKQRAHTRSDPDAIKEFKPPPPPAPPHPPPASPSAKQVKKKNLMRMLSYGSGMEMTQKNKTKSSRVSPAVTRRRMSFAGGKRSNSFVGTEEYVSPEVVRAEGHEFGVDWWALGVLAYEMLYGRTPFRGKNRKETFRNILTKQPEFFGKRTALIDLIERLLEKDPGKRLGHFRGSSEIKEHEFFNGLAWEVLTEVRPPFVPGGLEGLTEKLTAGFEVRDYFLKLRAPVSTPSSPVRSRSSAGDEETITITEF